MHNHTGLTYATQSIRKADEIAEAYVGLHWEWQEYGALWEVNEDKINRWAQEILIKNVTREVTDSEGRNRTEILVRAVDDLLAV